MVNLNQVQGFFGDVSNVVDYRQALDTIRATQEAFDSLPVEIRKLCQNNPENLIEVMNNKDNVEILQKNGMLQKGEEAKLEDVVEVLKSIKQGVGTENLVTMVPTDTNGVKNVSRETMEENK